MDTNKHEFDRATGPNGGTRGVVAVLATASTETSGIRRSPRRTPLQLLHRSVSALAPAEFFHGSKQIFPGKIGPQLWRHVHLSVGSLPKKKVGETHFAGGVNKQVRIGIVACVKMLAEHLHIDHGLIDVTQLNRAEQTFDAIDDFQPAAIAQCKDKRETGVAGGLLDSLVKLILRAVRQISQTANRLKTHIFLD